MKKSKKLLSILLACLMIISMFPAAVFAEDGTNTTITANSADSLKTAVDSANAGDTINVPAGTYDLTTEPLVIDKRINLVGAGADQTKIIGQIQYKFSASQDNATLTISGLTIQSAESDIQGLQFRGDKPNNGYELNIVVENCIFDGWQMGITMNSHANGYNLIVRNTSFPNTLCGVSYNYDNKTTGQIANNSLKFEGTISVDPGCYAVQKFGNAYVDGKPTTDNYYESVEDFNTDTSVPENPTLVANAVAKVGNTFYSNLQEAVSTASTNSPITVEIVRDITLSQGITVPTGANVTINGNGHTISYPVAVKAAFAYVQSGTELNLNNVSFEISDASEPPTTGFAVVTAENTNGISITATNCSFSNLYSGIYFGHFEGDNTGALSMTGCTFDNTKYAYSVDNVTNGSSVAPVDVTFEDNTLNGTTASESWNNIIVTKANGTQTAYHEWAAAIAAAATGDVIDLHMDITDAITIDKAVTVNSNGHKITGGVTVSAAGVTLNGLDVTTNGPALTVGTEGMPVVGDITVNGGSYVTTNGDLQGAGTLIIWANGTVTVNDVTTTGAIHVFNPGSYDISDNTVGFTYTGNTAFAGIMIYYANSESVPENPIAAANDLMAKNDITVPNTASDYVQIATPSVGGDEWNKPGQIPASDSAAKIGNAYYKTLQDAVDAVANNGIITIVTNCDQDATVSRVVTFTINTAENVSFTGSILAGDGYRVTENNGVYTVSEYQPPDTSKYSYEIFTTVGDNGAIDVDRYATEGDKVTITVSPDEAYMLDEMTITSGGKDVEVTDNGDGTYTFTMPSGDVKIEVTFAEDPNWEPEPEEPAMPFVDVNEGDWFYDVVLYAYENGLMTGTSADTFAPNTATTRGMIVSMLARLEGVTSAESAGFTDVADNDWYATAVNWAASEGIVNGFEDDTFRPNAPITREQMAAILYNYADYKGYDVSARADLSDYADAASISSWAEDVLAWANAEGLINGMTATTIDPQGATTRAQTAAMFERFLTAHAE